MAANPKWCTKLTIVVDHTAAADCSAVERRRGDRALRETPTGFDPIVTDRVR